MNPEIAARITIAQEQLARYFSPPPPPQEEILGSPYIGLIDYYLYEGADLADLLPEIALVLADAIVSTREGLDATLRGSDVVLSDGVGQSINVSAYVVDEWRSASPSPEGVALRILTALGNKVQ